MGRPRQFSPEEIKQHKAAYREKHKEEIKAYMKADHKVRYPKNLKKKQAQGRAFYAEHREELLAYMKKRHLKNPEKNAGYERTKHLKVFFRLTPEEWETISAYQGGVCAITGKPPATKRLSTDHSHKSGLVRGLLSMEVNRGIALFHDDPALLRKAADYLENPPAIQALGREVYGILGKAKYKKVMIYGSPNGPIKPERKRARKKKR